MKTTTLWHNVLVCQGNLHSNECDEMKRRCGNDSSAESADSHFARYVPVPRDNIRSPHFDRIKARPISM